MAESPPAEQLESVLNTTVQLSANWSLDPLSEATGKSVLDYWIIILSLVIAVIGLVGNSIVLWLLGFRTQRSPFSVYILNLAAADALFLGSYFGLRMWVIVGELNLLLVLLWPCLLGLPYCVGLSLLAAISTERCLSVLFPLWYRCHRPKQTSAAVCTILWALPGLYWGVFVALHFLNKNHFYNYFYPFLCFVEFGWFFLLTCVLGVSSLTLVLRVQCSSQRRRPPRLYLLVLLTVLVFLLCGLPWGVIDVVWFFSGSSLKRYRIFRLLACVNSSANPFIYFFLGSQWRKRGREPLRVILQRALGEEQVGGDGGRDTSNPNMWVNYPEDENKMLRQGSP
ncbi:mas-related G-protein coupled receptor member X4-like [Monodelphis domestica]|uniref:Mas-related G-protein coupled receptor member X4-like n=1 Tax=Monodelphis domestica TaxID=13616 RepID=F6TEL7_MONDO|nr:mas-related G-protein coupled receptor member X4-like [Monodelphis domestica]